MKRFRFLPLALCALLAGHAGAAPVSPDDAKHAVAAWLATASIPDGENIRSILPANVISYDDDNGTILFHVVVLREGGFVVTTADDTLSPILVYSTTGDPPDENPDNPFWEFATRIVLGRHAVAERLGKNDMDAEWAALLDIDLARIDAADPRERLDDTYVVSPLLKNASAQILQSDCGSPIWLSNYASTYKYKNIATRYSEALAEDSGWPWGCATVAFAKIIAYHGEGTGDASYNWETIAGSASSQAELALLDKVARELNIQYKLTIGTNNKYGSGILVSGNMKFDYAALNGSSASEIIKMPGAVSAFKNGFGYKNAVESYASNGFAPKWLDLVLRSNLNAGLPVALAGGDHVFVVDGYGFVGETPYFHMDMGWIFKDFWWNLSSPIISPIPEYRDKDGVDFSVDYAKEIIYNIHPAKSFDKLVTGCVTMMGVGIGAEVKLTLPNGATATQTTDDGVYAFYVTGGITGQATITASLTAGTTAGSALESLGISVAQMQAAVQTAIKPVTVPLALDDESNYCCDIVLDPSTYPIPTPSPSKTYVTVTFDATGGSVFPASRSVVVGTVVGALPKPTRKGYVFAGWYTAKSNGAEVSASTKISKNTTFYAQWAKRSYKVKFYANGGKGKMSVEKFTYGKAKKLKANKFKRKGYTFLGWSKKKNGPLVYKNKKAVKNLTMKGGTVKLYAKWGKKVVIKFNANGGTVKKKQKSCKAGQAIGSLPKPTRKGWVFDGWCLSKYGFGDLVGSHSAFYSSVTLYARWSKSKKLPKGSYTRTVKGVVWKFDISNKKATVTGVSGRLPKPSALRIPSKLGGRPVTSIGANAFYGRSEVTSVAIPNRVKSIGYQAFGYSGLTRITIPNSVKSIGNKAFSGCSALTSITVPDSVTSIEDEAFWGCSKLATVQIGNNVKSIGRYAFQCCPELAFVTIGNGVTSIGPQMFSSCSKLTSITIGSGVKSIGQWAFSGCSGLASITIPDNVTSIGGYAFYGCSGLTSISIPAHLQGQVSSWSLPSSCRIIVR